MKNKLEKNTGEQTAENMVKDIDSRNKKSK